MYLLSFGDLAIIRINEYSAKNRNYSQNKSKVWLFYFDMFIKLLHNKEQILTKIVVTYSATWLKKNFFKNWVFFPVTTTKKQNKTNNYNKYI